jgi:hypothetical protein
MVSLGGVIQLGATNAVEVRKAGTTMETRDAEKVHKVYGWTHFVQYYEVLKVLS